jgi:hypothetical protein
LASDVGIAAVLDIRSLIKATLTPKPGLKPRPTAPTNLQIEALNK